MYIVSIFEISTILHLFFYHPHLAYIPVKRLLFFFTQNTPDETTCRLPASSEVASPLQATPSMLCLLVRRCQDRVEVCVTRIPSFKPVIIRSFETRQEVIDACMASVHIPFFLDGRPTASVKGAQEPPELAYNVKHYMHDERVYRAHRKATARCCYIPKEPPHSMPSMMLPV